MTTPAAPVSVKRPHKRKISREEFAKLYTEKCIGKTLIDAAVSIGVSPATYNKYLIDLEQHRPEMVKRQPLGRQPIFSPEEFRTAYKARKLHRMPKYKAAVIMGISPSTFDRYYAEMRKNRHAN